MLFPQLFRYYRVTWVNAYTSRMYQQTYWNGWGVSVLTVTEIMESGNISEALDQTIFKSDVHREGNLLSKKKILKMMFAQQKQLRATSGNCPNLFFVSAPNLGLARNCCRPRTDCQLWIYGRSWYKPRTLTLLWRAGAFDARNARELLEEEISTLISNQGGPLEQETFSMPNGN